MSLFNLIITENKVGENIKDDRGMKEWRGIRGIVQKK